MTRAERATTPATLLACDRGAVLVEYMAVWGFAIIAITVAIIALGPALGIAWGVAKGVLISTSP